MTGWTFKESQLNDELYFKIAPAAKPRTFVWASPLALKVTHPGCLDSLLSIEDQRYYTQFQFNEVELVARVVFMSYRNSSSEVSPNHWMSTTPTKSSKYLSISSG